MSDYMRQFLAFVSGAVFTLLIVLVLFDRLVDAGMRRYFVLRKKYFLQLDQPNEEEEHGAERDGS